MIINLQLPQPVDEWFYQTVEMLNRILTTLKKFGQIINFVCAKQVLEPIRSFITCLQDNYGLRKIEKIIHTYKETHE